MPALIELICVLVMEFEEEFIAVVDPNTGARVHLSKDEEAERAKRAKEVAPATDAAPEAPKPSAAPAKPKTRQPWKGQQNTRGFGKLNIPRRSGGS